VGRNPGVPVPGYGGILVPIAWLILQVADVVPDKIGVPDWTFKVVLVFLLAARIGNCLSAVRLHE